MVLLENDSVTAGRSQCPEKATWTPSSPQTINVFSAPPMARRKLAVITTKDIKFQMAYSNLLRAHIDGLKKEDKKCKSKKTKATQ
ncbi:signal recognition particle 14 kDa protein-like [Stigmatopora nigra]